MNFIHVQILLQSHQCWQYGLSKRPEKYRLPKIRLSCSSLPVGYTIYICCYILHIYYRVVQTYVTASWHLKLILDVQYNVFSEKQLGLCHALILTHLHSRNFCRAVDVNETNWAQVRTTSQQICHRGDQRLFSKSGPWHGEDDGVIMIMVIMVLP